MTIERMVTILEELKMYCYETEDRCNLTKHEPKDYALKYIGDFMIFED